MRQLFFCGLLGCFLTGNAVAQSFIVTGKITDEYALPMTGVTVQVF